MANETISNYVGKAVAAVATAVKNNTACKVDIYIREIGGNREIRIPWLPDTIKYTTGEATMASYEILNRGEVAVPTGVGLFECSWESIFPGVGRKTSDCGMMRGEWKNPSTYDLILKDWKKNGTKLNLLVVGYPINKTVYLTNYDGEGSGGFGDITYSLEFKEAVNITIKSSKTPTKSSASTNSTANSVNRVVEAVKIVTVKSGDTLWKIAEKNLGSGAKWTDIYALNKTIIEKTATARWKAAGISRGSQNGHWIFAGTKLIMPVSNAERD